MKMTIVLATLAVSIPVFAQTALAPLEPGTVFTFNSNGASTTITIKQMDGVAIHQEQVSPSGTRVTELVGFGVNLGTEKSETMSDSNREKVSSLFPLKVGNKAQYDHSGVSNGRPWTMSDKTETISEESVTVAAGTYKTIVIQTEMSGGSFNGQNTCWYAPEIGYCAKMQTKQRGSADLVRELVSVTTPK